jgi:hypothetical protein
VKADSNVRLEISLLQYLLFDFLGLLSAPLLHIFLVELLLRTALQLYILPRGPSPTFLVLYQHLSGIARDAMAWIELVRCVLLVACFSRLCGNVNKNKRELKDMVHCLPETRHKLC